MRSPYQTESADGLHVEASEEQKRTEARIENNLQEARTVMADILKRKLYKFVGQTQIKVQILCYEIIYIPNSDFTAK
jgi:hypothetical protein